MDIWLTVLHPCEGLLKGTDGVRDMRRLKVLAVLMIKLIQVHASEEGTWEDTLDVVEVFQVPGSPASGP